MKFFSRVEGLFSYIIHIMIHTIKDAVGISNWSTCRISRGCRLTRNVPHYVFRCRDYPSLNPWKENLLHLLVYWYACLIVETKMQWDYFHKDSSGLWTVMYCCLHLFKVAFEIDLDLALFLFNLLYVKFFSLLMHTIQDKVGIPNCGTLCISICYVFNWIVFVITVFSLIPCSSSFLFWNQFFFISSLCIFSLGVLCHLFNHFRKCITSYKSLSYHSCLFLLCAISFFLWLWNLAFEILELVLFLFDLLSGIPFCCLRL